MRTSADTREQKGFFLRDLSTTLISTGETAQQGINNPEDSLETIKDNFLTKMVE